MKKLYFLAALLAATTSAHAGTVSFEIEGKRVNIEMPPHCRSVSCLVITAPGVSGFNAPRSDDDGDSSPAPERPDFKGPHSGRFNDDARASGPGRPGFYGGRRFNDDDRASGPGRPDFNGGRRFNDDDRASGPGRPGFDGGRRFNDDENYASGRPGRPVYKGAYNSKRTNDDDNNASRPDRAPASVPVPAAPAPPATTIIAATPPAQADVAPPAPDPIRVVPTTPERKPAPVAAEPDSEPNSPIGTWATEENKGNVRIEQCGDNLCGYSAKSGEKVLINMKQQGSKWAGRVHEADSGRKYDSTMTMKGNNTLRVQGCGFGGLFCGNQTWKRVS